MELRPARGTDEFALPWEPYDGTTTLVFHGIAMLGVAGALGNMLQWPDMHVGSLVASLLWLALYAGRERHLVREAGWRNSLVARAEIFSRDRFIKVNRPLSGPTTLHFGFRLGGREFSREELRVEGIERIYWSTGQCSALAGKDTNDWIVVFWVRVMPVPISERTRSSQACEVSVFHTPGSRRDADSVGQAFLRYLADHGHPFRESESPPDRAVYGYSDSSPVFVPARDSQTLKS